MGNFFHDFTQKQMTKVVEIIQRGILVEEHNDYYVFLYFGKYYFLSANGLYEVELVEKEEKNNIRPIAFIGLRETYKRFQASDKNLYFETNQDIYKVVNN